MNADDIDYAHAVLQRAIVLIAMQTDSSVFEVADILQALITDKDFKIWTQKQYENAEENGL